jgi:hypothetical protein
MRPLPHPLPREIVRDLLGITRALYRAELAKASSDRARLERLLQIGQQYRQPLQRGANTRRTQWAAAQRSTGVQPETTTPVMQTTRRQVFDWAPRRWRCLNPKR